MNILHKLYAKLQCGSFRKDWETLKRLSFSQKLRFLCFSLTSISSTVTLAVAAYAVWIRLFEVMESNERTGTLLIPYWHFYIFEFLAMALLAIVLLRDAIKAVYAIADKETAEEIQTTWV